MALAGTTLFLLLIFFPVLFDFLSFLTSVLLATSTRLRTSVPRYAFSAIRLIVVPRTLLPTIHSTSYDRQLASITFGGVSRATQYNRHLASITHTWCRVQRYPIQPAPCKYYIIKEELRALSSNFKELLKNGCPFTCSLGVKFIYKQKQNNKAPQIL